ncbi:4-hydroxybenzoate octaprenyltransferase [Roseiconus nitratireducens]|uniref:4-hydroxybenzoate polyprenyltransferase n=1 Tax=Roseiconus nitratireducens TaxID=2605748 RepID=A0A5M6D603_9BACT|nr:4-hydroxybenzoate octaprenyltransferase [Roseiconus nitratireducens]KAA5540635.1 4-hydroxybenzoate octaprenyltransferase [Roseiconus nitratireducens]
MSDTDQRPIEAIGSTRHASAKLSDWLGLIRFSHTIFALPFAALAAAMAVATPLPSGPLPSGEFATAGLRELVGILLCMVTARSAAMAFNRLVDHRIDAANPRTKNRHLPAGILSRRAVAAFTVACCVAFIASTGLFWPNWVPLAGSVPVLLFLLGYSLAKRFTSAAHLWLGVALSLSPICTWLAIRGPESLLAPADLLAPLLLAVAVAAWVTGFDIIYACQDAEFDAGAGLHSVPGRFGVARALRIAAGCHALMLLVLFALPWLAPQVGFGWLYGIALLAIAALVVRQHSLVRPEDLDRVGEAFFTANAAISVTLLIAGAADCLWV